MKRIFSIVFALALVASTAMSFGYYIKGDTENGNKFGTITLVGVTGAALSVASASTGLQWTRTEETLLNRLADPKAAGPQVFENYRTGRLRFRDFVLYRALLIDGASSIVKIWDNNVAKAIGVSNVKDAKLDKDTTICIDTILLEYANSGGAGTDPAAIAGYDSVVTSWPAPLVNGELTILQDGNPLLEDHPCFTCGSPADSMFAKGAADGYKLKTPFILEGDKEFEVRLNFAGTVSPANTDFLKISLFGVGTRKRGNL